MQSWKAFATALILAATLMGATGAVFAADPEPSPPWDLAALSTPPEFEWRNASDPVRSLYYAGDTYAGRATRVFAWYATPGSLSGVATRDRNLPAVVLVHGGGGTAFREWCELWAGRGYAAIAMDLAGYEPKDGLNPHQGENRTRLEEGGPNQSDNEKFGAIDQPLTEQWPYHAVANVIRAHSLIRSFPEVDAQRTAVTGISWGGYLTCIVAGVDDRFAAAVPVYGCGYLHENSVWLDRFAAMTAEQRARWVRLWDPSQYLPQVKMPILFVNGTNDFAYPLDSYMQSYDAVPGEKQLCVTVNMPHSHPAGWAPQEIGLFIDHHLLGSAGLVELQDPVVEDGAVSVRFQEAQTIKEAALHFTSGTEAINQRTWESLPATIDGEHVRCAAPPAAATAWFITATDDRGAVASTRIVFAEPDESERQADGFRPRPLQATIDGVQPGTGIVLWTTNEHVATDAVQLEFAYMRFDDLIPERGRYDWASVEQLLDAAAGRGHQMVLRFHDVYVGRETTVPAYIKALPDYREVRARSEQQPTSFSDWSHPEWRRCVLEFYERFAERFDDDPRLAYVQAGFGLWAEYHIYDGPMELGRTFPSREFQGEFARRLARVFRRTPWMISVDAAGDHAPFADSDELLDLPFGVFDDSFLCEQHARENEPNWNALRRSRWQSAPAGGEFSYYTDHDQARALAPLGPHGVPFEEQAQRFHITFIIGDGQTEHQPPERIRQAGLACGYKFRVTLFETSADQARVEITNTGVAPLYHDAWPAVNGVRSEQSLRGLLPGESQRHEIASGGDQPRFTIAADRLVPGQQIGFAADLK